MAETDDGKFVTACFRAHIEPDGTSRANLFAMISAWGVSYKHDPQREKDYEPMARRIFEEHGRISKGAPYYRLEGRLILVPGDDQS